MAYGGLETGPGEGPSAPHVLGAATRSQAGTELRTQPAQRSSGDSPLSPSASPPTLSPALGARGAGGRGGNMAGLEAGKGREGDRTRSDAYHVCVDLNCSHQAVNGL